MGSELKNLFRKLEWKDFTKNDHAPEPKPGVPATAAKTDVDYTYSGVNFNRVPGTKPAVYRLADTVVVTIRLKPFPGSWKSKWLSKFPRPSRTRSSTMSAATIASPR